MKHKPFLEWLEDMIDMSLRHNPEKTKEMLRRKISPDEGVSPNDEKDKKSEKVLEDSYKQRGY